MQIPFEDLVSRIKELLEETQQSMFERAKENLLNQHTPAHTLDEAKEIIGEKGRFHKDDVVRGRRLRERVKEEAGMSSRCIPFEQEHFGDDCAICGKPAKHIVYWGIAY